MSLLEAVLRGSILTGLVLDGCTANSDAPGRRGEEIYIPVERLMIVINGECPRPKAIGGISLRLSKWCALMDQVPKALGWDEQEYRRASLRRFCTVYRRIE